MGVQILKRIPKKCFGSSTCVSSTMFMLFIKTVHFFQTFACILEEDTTALNTPLLRGNFKAAESFFSGSHISQIALMNSTKMLLKAFPSREHDLGGNLSNKKIHTPKQGISQ